MTDLGWACGPAWRWGGSNPAFAAAQGAREGQGTGSRNHLATNNASHDETPLQVERKPQTQRSEEKQSRLQAKTTLTHFSVFTLCVCVCVGGGGGGVYVCMCVCGLQIQFQDKCIIVLGNQFCMTHQNFRSVENESSGTSFFGST